MRVDFYHVTRDDVATVAARLSSRAIAGSQRLLVVAQSADARAAIDAALWAAVPDSFLPHAPAETDPMTCIDEPIVIAAAMAFPAPNRAAIVMIADGGWDDVATQFDRALLLFDTDTIDHARQLWRDLASDAAIDRHYWKQDGNGQWREGP